MNKSETWDFCAPEYETIAQKVTGPCIVKLLEEVSLLPVTSSTSLIKVIDLAAGPGFLATFLGEAYAQAGQLEKLTILSTDFSPNMVELTQARFTTRNWPATQFSARALDASDLVDVPSNYYTHAFCTFGLMMIPNAMKAVSEMFRVLQPSGMIGIGTWKSVGWFPIVAECLAQAKGTSTDEENSSSLKTIKHDWADTSYVQKVLEDAGFQNVQVTLFDSRLPFANHNDCVREFTQARWIQPFISSANLTDEQLEKYTQVLPQVLLNMVGKNPDQAFDLPMIAILAHGQKPVN